MMLFLKTIWSFIHVNLICEFESNLMSERAFGTYTVVFLQKTK